MSTTHRTLLCTLAVLLAAPAALAQPTSAVYDLVREAGASSTDATTLSSAFRTVADQEANLSAADAAAGDEFGYSVSLSGGRALVGARRDDDAGEGSGAAYVFVRSGGTWTQEAKLTASDAAMGDEFGTSVSLVGERALVGAPNDRDAGVASGAAYIFVRSGSTWTQELKLTASDAAANDFFGGAVSLAEDRALVGAFGDANVGYGSGSAYVFVRSGSTWTQEDKLTASDAAQTDFFGSAVSLAEDRALVGAYQDDDSGTSSGSAYVFVRSGAMWTQEAKLTASDAAGGDFFGFTLALSGDRALVGSLGDDDAGLGSGSAYVFVRSGGMWTQEAKLTATDAEPNDAFGGSVSLEGDRALVGADFDSDAGTASGSAYLFVRSGGTWTQEPKLTATDAAAADRFGRSVSLSGDLALIGAYGDDDGAENSGSAYVFSGVVGTAAEPSAEAKGVTLSATPNPAHGAATVTLTLDVPQTLSVAVFDVLGRQVARLHDGPLAAGPHVLRLDATHLPAGVYVVRASGATEAISRRLTVVR